MNGKIGKIIQGDIWKDMRQKFAPFISFSVFILIFLSYSVTTHAHLDGGADKTIKDYLIDFGFSPEKPKAGEKVTLAFNLVNATTKEIIEPTSVWVRISSP